MRRHCVLKAAQRDPISAYVVPPILHVAGDSNSRRAVPLPKDFRPVRVRIFIFLWIVAKDERSQS
jgi:hypothetical protein